MEGSSKSQKDKNKIYGKKGEYSVLGKIGEGTFSEVIKVQNEKDGSLWACKRMKQRFDKVEDIQRIREIQVKYTDLVLCLFFCSTYFFRHTTS